LVAAAEVNDFEPGRTHRTNGRLEYALLVGSAVNQRSCSAADPTGVGHPVPMSKAYDSTQVLMASTDVET
jgi:hypothetical protein